MQNVSYKSCGSGGSSFISGHEGCNAVNYSASGIQHTGSSVFTFNGISYIFTETLMIDGGGNKWTNVQGSTQQMPNPNGGYYETGVGQAGNGYARITNMN